MAENINYTNLKSAYYDLINQYFLYLNQVSSRKTDRILRLMVEDHIRAKLLEIDKSMQFTIHRLNTELNKDELTWLKSESVRCKESAACLRNANDTLKTIWRISWRIALILFTFASLLQFRQLSNLSEVFLNLNMLTELVLSNLNYIIYGWVGLMYVVVIIVFFGLMEKRTMFAPGYNPLFGNIEDEDVIKDSVTVYQLEDKLFQQFDRDKRPEFKIDIPIMFLFTISLFAFIYIVSREYVLPYFGETLTWIISVIMALIALLSGLRYIRTAFKRQEV